MEQVKVFESGHGTSMTSRLSLEEEMNKWLTQMGNSIEITRCVMGQSQYAEATVIIFYKKIQKPE